jgi:SNF2 family DNA or RNA helicase
MQFAPHPYQVKAIQMMAMKDGSAMLLDPGMGKTSIALAAVCVLQAHKAIEAALVIVPIRPMTLTWPNEVKKWEQFSHLRVSIIHGTPAQRLAAMAKPADVYLINPENVAWLADSTKMGSWAVGDPLACFAVKPAMLIVDESTRFKNASSKRFKALKTLLPYFTRAHILTGTIMPQSIEDLFAQFQIVDGGERLGRYITHFRKQFMDSETIRIGGGRTIEKWHARRDALPLLTAKIADVSMRLQAEDYLTMPKLSHNIIPVQLPPAVRKVYNALADDLVAKTSAGATLTAASAAAAVMKLRQITNGWAYGEEESVHLHDAKLDALADLVEEQSGSPIIVAVAFLHEVPAIRAALKSVLPEGTEIPYLGGGVSRFQADVITTLWNAGEVPVLIVHPTSVAHGLNLQAGGHALVWFGLTWNSEEHDQCNARVYRQGQSKPVVIHYLTAKDTVDEDIAKALATKTSVQASVLNSLKKA